MRRDGGAKGAGDSGRLAEAEAALFQADEAALADDDVVEQFDVEDFACFA